MTKNLMNFSPEVYKELVNRAAEKEFKISGFMSLLKSKIFDENIRNFFNESLDKMGMEEVLKVMIDLDPN